MSSARKTVPNLTSEMPIALPGALACRRNRPARDGREPDALTANETHVTSRFAEVGRAVSARRGRHAGCGCNAAALAAMTYALPFAKFRKRLENSIFRSRVAC